jgi:hypothetical protein
MMDALLGNAKVADTTGLRKQPPWDFINSKRCANMRLLHAHFPQAGSS